MLGLVLVGGDRLGLLATARGDQEKHHRGSNHPHAFARGPCTVNVCSGMDLLVIRHGIAEVRVPHEDDATRRLTRTGERRIRGVVSGLRTLGWKLDGIVTSPWLRAARTAELLEKLCKTDAVVTELLTQSPSAELLALVSTSATTKKHHATAIVGHEPWLGQLVGWLAFGDGRFGDGLGLKKGAVAWLQGDVAPGGMTLQGLLPPGVTRALG